MNVLLCALIYLAAKAFADQEIVEANNKFAAKLYTQILQDNDGNFIFSPLSLGSVLALTQTGARGETSEEIRRVLNLPRDKFKTKSGFQDLIISLDNRKYDFHFANKIYLKSSFALNRAFRRTAEDFFKAHAETIDFAKSSEAADLINKWVQKQTQDKITRIVDPFNLDFNTKLIIVNALYFKSKFRQPFSEKYTILDTFYAGSESKIQTPMMRKTAIYNFLESADLNAKFLELPLERHASLTLILPSDDGDFELDDIFEAKDLKPFQVEVKIPKFKIETKLDLKPLLQNLGIRRAFDENADFSGIAKKSGTLMVSDIVQKSFIEVNENGVEASSATAGTLTKRSGSFGFERATFIADRPFVYYVKVEGVVVFAGKVTDPAK